MPRSYVAEAQKGQQIYDCLQLNATVPATRGDTCVTVNLLYHGDNKTQNYKYPSVIDAVSKTRQQTHQPNSTLKTKRQLVIFDIKKILLHASDVRVPCFAPVNAEGFIPSQRHK